MGPSFRCAPVGEGFLEAAPTVLRESFEISRPATEVWADLTAEHPLGYARLIDDITWTSPRPFRVGTTRTATALKGLNVLEERFFNWEEGSRKSFMVERTTSPLFRRFAEDYLVEPTGEDSCRFTWTIAYEARLLARLAEPLNQRLLRTLFTDTRAHYGAA